METAINKTFPEIDESKIQSAYHGKIGCMCGCLGNYYYSEKWREEVSRNRGYKITNDEINDGVIEEIVGIMKKNGARFEVAVNNNNQNICRVYTEIGDRCYCIYLS